MSQRLQELFTSNTLSNAPIAKMSKDIRDDFDVDKQYADRLIITESNYFHNQSELKGYEDSGYTKYQYMSVMDNRTSKVCQELDDQIFEVKNAKAGENLPPMHSNNRSTTVPYLSSDLMPTTRFARNLEPNDDNPLDTYTTYKEYKSKLPYKDVTNEWRLEANKKIAANEAAILLPEVIEPKIGDIINYKGVDYEIDGKNVVYDASVNEIEFAQWLSKEFSENVEMIPRVNNPEGVKAPDYLFKNNYWELKAIKSSNPSSLYNNVKKKKEQSSNFIFDLTESTLEIESCKKIIKQIFTNERTDFVKEIMIVKSKFYNVYKK
ncbi:minor capsid protein [Mycoplasma sp. P36-A1]|uniref:minor capsid protein n=1 Tax=Mycoplasma sp. P36-A1 TaxID=3252900 RepID=UPI003C2C42AA